MATSAFAKLDIRHVIPISGMGKTDIIPSFVISTYDAEHDITDDAITCKVKESGM